MKRRIYNNGPRKRNKVQGIKGGKCGISTGIRGWVQLQALTV